MKDTIYFRHDCNAHSDPKIVKLRMKFGREGYGIYRSMIEIMREESEVGIKKEETDSIAFRLGIEQKYLDEIISHCLDIELFEFDEALELFYSARLKEDTEYMREKSKKARESAKARRGQKEKRNKKIRSQRLAEAREKGTHTKEEWDELVSFFGGICVKCEGESELENVEKDHIIPISHGGSDAITNLQPLCAKCNAGKGSEDIDWRIQYCARHGKQLDTKYMRTHIETQSEMPAIKEKKGKDKKESIKSISLPQEKSGGTVIQKYPFIDNFVTQQSVYHQVKHQIEKKGLEAYLLEQYDFVRLLLKDGYDLESIETLLNFVLQDDFWSKQIMTVGKLRKKNRDGVPYGAVILDKMVHGSGAGKKKETYADLSSYLSK